MGKKSRRPAPSSAATQSKDAHTNPANPANFSYMYTPHLLQVVHSLTLKGQVPQEAMFYAVHRLMAMERQHGTVRGFHSLVHGSAGMEHTTQFVHQVLQHMAHDREASQEDHKEPSTDTNQDDAATGTNQDDAATEQQEEQEQEMSEE